jgi:hypothetical protein
LDALELASRVTALTLYSSGCFNSRLATDPP